MLAHLVGDVHGSSRELAGSIPAMVDFAGFTQTIIKGTWLEELDYVND